MRPYFALKLFRFFMVSYHLFYDLERSYKVTRYYNFFSQYVKELVLITKNSLMPGLRTRRPTHLRVITSF
jgi:hypothetical protein